MSYEKEYKVIDEILEGATKPTSPFTAKDGAAMIDGLLERAGHIPIWLLSLGNEVVTIGELEEKMRRLGRETRAIEIAYQHLPAVATEEKKERNREYLIVGWDPNAPLFRQTSMPRATLTDEIPQVHVVGLPEVVHPQPNGSRSEQPPPNHLTQDGLKESEPCLTQQQVAGLELDTLSQPQLRVDLPEPRRDETARGADREVGVVHAPLVGGNLGPGATGVKETSR
jgi:hypothetical protein